MQSLPQTSQQEICPPVQEGFDPESQTAAEMMRWDGAKSQAEDIATQAIAENQTTPSGREQIDTIKQTILDLGCAACNMSGCKVYDVLQEREQSEATKWATDQLLLAPDWLNLVRIKAFGSERFSKYKKPQTIRADVESGELNPEAMLGGLTTKLKEIYDIADVPELAGISTKDGVQVVSHIITQEASGQTIEVIDASSAVNSGVSETNISQQAILYSKLLAKAFSVNASGDRQILQPDGKIQKALRTQPNGSGRLDEIRMNGKNRLYIMVSGDTESSTPRIIILGNHGGDEATQDKFISSVVRSSNPLVPSYR